MINNKTDKKNIQISKGAIISIIVVLILVIIWFLSPKAYLVTTARYGKGTEEDNTNVKIALGETNTEERFKIYFQWYNVIHELGHGILIYNSDIKISNAEEEQLVNDFAVAYWLHYGEEEKINELSNIVEHATANINSDAETGINHIEFAEKNWNKSSFFTFNNYGWFQFNCVKQSLNERKSLDEVLKEMGIENIKLPEPKQLTYPTINEEVSTKIIDDAVENFNEWGLEFPKVYHFFNDDPNANYSRNARNVLGIYGLIENF